MFGVTYFGPGNNNENQLQKHGIVEEAQVDLAKKLIVLCGPNNSGKTYIAYTLYGLLSATSYVPRSRIRSRLPKLSNDTLSNEKWEVDIFSLLKDDDYSVLMEYVSDFKHWLADVFATDSNRFYDAELAVIDIENSDLEDTIRKYFINVSYQFPGHIYHFEKTVGSLLLRCSLEISRSNGDQMNAQELISTRRLVRDDLVPTLILKSLFPNSFISPPQRTAVNIFSKELSLKRNRVVDEMLRLREQKER